MPAARLLLFNKPFRVLSQFSASGERATLAAFVDVPDVYPAGRLDYDSEGLLLLTNDGRLQALLSQPRHHTWKTYWAQVEGLPGDAALQSLCVGVELKDGPTLPARARPISGWCSFRNRRATCPSRPRGSSPRWLRRGWRRSR